MFDLYINYLKYLLIFLACPTATNTSSAIILNPELNPSLPIGINYTDITINNLNSQIEKIKKSNEIEIAKIKADNSAEILKLNQLRIEEKKLLKDDVNRIYNQYAEIHYVIDGFFNQIDSEFRNSFNQVDNYNLRKNSNIQIEKSEKSGNSKRNKERNLQITNLQSPPIYNSLYHNDETRKLFIKTFLYFYFDKRFPKYINYFSQKKPTSISLSETQIIKTNNYPSMPFRIKSENYSESLKPKDLNKTLESKQKIKNDKKNEKKAQNNLRNLESNPLSLNISNSTTPTITTTTILNENISFQQKMQTIFSSYKFPKMMIIHRGVEVNSRNENPVNFIYNFDVLDYLDPITGNPNVYDVFLQKVDIFVDYGGFIFPIEPKKVEFIIVNKIEKNQLDSLSNSGAYLSFKLFSDSKQIYVKYTSFNSVLETFGSFYAIFTLLAFILTSFFRQVFFNMRLTNSIFKFIDNSPNSEFYIKNDIRNFILNKENNNSKEKSQIKSKESIGNSKNSIKLNNDRNNEDNEAWNKLRKINKLDDKCIF